MEVSKEIQQQLQEAQNAVDSLEAAMQPLSTKSWKEFETQVPDPLTRARAFVALAHCITVLFDRYLRTAGIDVDEHALMKEKERWRLYDKKLRRLINECELKTSSRTTTINLAAANRFIEHAIPDLSAEQRTALKQANTSHSSRKRPGRGTASTVSAVDEHAQPDADAFLSEVLDK